VTVNSFGKGRAIYCAAPLFAAYYSDGTPALGHLARWMLDLVYPANRRSITIQNAPANIELMYNRRGDTQFVHLVNFTGDRRLHGAQRIIHDMTPAGRMLVSVRRERRPREVHLVPENTAVPFERKESRLSFQTTPLLMHQIWMIRAEEG
jgi:hypothetical protein